MQCYVHCTVHFYLTSNSVHCAAQCYVHCTVHYYLTSNSIHCAAQCYVHVLFTVLFTII